MIVAILWRLANSPQDKITAEMPWPHPHIHSDFQSQELWVSAPPNDMKHVCWTGYKKKHLKTSGTKKSSKGRTHKCNLKFGNLSCFRETYIY